MIKERAKRLFKFEKAQRVFQIGQIKIGGQPGELSTTLIGSIFYKGHKIVKDSQKGIFDKAQAEKLIKNQEELQDVTGCPGLLDVVVSSVDAIEKQIDFISATTNTPFIFDAWPPKIRIEGLKYLTQVGLIEKTIYNSISPTTKINELKAIKAAELKTAILLAYNFKNPWVKGLMTVIQGSPEQKGLLDMAETAGIDQPMIDTCVTSVPSIGISARAIHQVKAELGIPTGCGAANATTRWKMPRETWGNAVFKACEASLQTLTLALGADFLMYGPIESANWIFPAAAAVDATVATAAKELGTSLTSEEHSLWKLFPKIAAKMG
ncbi:MAG: tetrahydromethanopterin S-methyltransferase subunit H [Candidatus Bathyarchaeota archaeon]|nr:tetrahydromethanopterin S-methyltransferase subunit H [Candidatus Bathyarchaeota archaeon]